MTKLAIMLLALSSFSTFAGAPFHLTVIPVEAEQPELVVEIENNLQKAMMSLSFYKCRTVKVSRTKLSEYSTGLFANKTQVIGSVFGVISNCENELVVDILSGLYDKDAEREGRFFNLDMDFILDGDVVNTRRWNFKQDL